MDWKQWRERLQSYKKRQRPRDESSGKIEMKQNMDEK
jgi:hypothetical protein